MIAAITGLWETAAIAISGKAIPPLRPHHGRRRVFDALTSKRCNKSAIPLEKAYAIILEESGTHFDPAVVDTFFTATEEIGAQRNAEANG